MQTDVRGQNGIWTKLESKSKAVIK